MAFADWHFFGGGYWLESHCLNNLHAALWVYVHNFACVGASIPNGLGHYLVCFKEEAEAQEQNRLSQ
jgi:hypothetical protein